MKRIIFITLLSAISILMIGQNAFKYPIIIGTNGGANGQITLNGSTSGSVVIKSNVVAGAGTVFQLPANNGTSGYLLSTDGAGVLSWIVPPVTMTYPGAGIPISTGAGWAGSLTNNSTNWDNAYTDRLKWDGGSTGLVAATGRTSLGGTTIGQAFFTMSNPASVVFFRGNADNTVTALSAANFKTALTLTSSDVGLGNVTNESKTTMFTNPTFTGTVAGVTATMVGLGNVTNESKATMFTSPTFTTAATLPTSTSIGDVSATEIGYVNGLNGTAASRQDISDSLDLKLAEAETGISLADSNLYITPYALTEAINAIEGSAVNDSLYKRYADTISIQLASIGRNIPADTALFVNGIWAGYQRWGGNDTLELKYVSSYLGQGTGDETLGFNILYSDTLGAIVPNKVFASDITTKAIIPTTGKINTGFAKAKIPPDSYMWVPISGVSEGNKPSLFGLTLSGDVIPGIGKSSLLDGLVAYYKFDESSGTVVNDALGTFNGVTTGSVNQDGILGKSINYSGTKLTTITTTASFNQSSQYCTVSCWVKFDSIPSTWDIYGQILYKGGHLDINVTTSGSIQAGFRYANPTEGKYAYKVGINALPTGVWHHIVAIANGTGNAVTGYFDGAPMSSFEVPSGSFDITSVQPLRVGNVYNFINPFNGSVDDVRIYNRVLSAEEVATTYNAGVGNIIIK